MNNWVSVKRLTHLGILGMNARNVEYIAQYNPRRLFPSVDNKLRTKLLLTEENLAVPDLLHTIYTHREIEQVGGVLEKHQDFVIKPAQGSGGKGILVIVGRDDEGFIKSNGDHLQISEIKRYLSNIVSGLHSLGGQQDVAIIERRVRINPMFERYSHQGVPDIRLIVFRGYPVMGMLRLATKASDGKANLHQGAVGVGIDLATGRGISAVLHDRTIEHHPDTGASFDDIQIPNWKTLLKLSSDCFDVTELGYLGVDIVLDKERGPMILELNARPGLSIQVANQKGLLPRLRTVKTLPRSQLSEARVDYAMDKFAHEPQTTQPQLFETALTNQGK